ncbi:hypothetical protein OXA72_15480 [Klebsiella pneumoniae]
MNENDFSFDDLTLDTKESRIVDLIISLIVGSINDMSRIDLNANNILDSVKSKIILFDTDQTSFVFKSGIGKKIRNTRARRLWQNRTIIAQTKRSLLKE